LVRGAGLARFQVLKSAQSQAQHAFLPALFVFFVAAVGAYAVDQTTLEIPAPRPITPPWPRQAGGRPFVRASAFGVSAVAGSAW
jgi:hypothetical protein